LYSLQEENRCFRLQPVIAMLLVVIALQDNTKPSQLWTTTHAIVELRQSTNNRQCLDSAHLSVCLQGHILGFRIIQNTQYFLPLDSIQYAEFILGGKNLGVTWPGDLIVRGRLVERYSMMRGRQYLQKLEVSPNNCHHDWPVRSFWWKAVSLSCTQPAPRFLIICFRLNHSVIYLIPNFLLCLPNFLHCLQIHRWCRCFEFQYSKWLQKHNWFQTVIKKKSNNKTFVKSNLVRFKSHNTDSIQEHFLKNNTRQQT